MEESWSNGEMIITLFHELQRIGKDRIFLKKNKKKIFAIQRVKLRKKSEGCVTNKCDLMTVMQLLVTSSGKKLYNSLSHTNPCYFFQMWTIYSVTENQFFLVTQGSSLQRF